MKYMALLMVVLFSSLQAASASSGSSATCRRPADIEQRIDEFKRAQTQGNLGRAVGLQLSLVPFLEENQRLSEDQILPSISELTNLLVRLNELDELVLQSTYLLGCYTAQGDHQEIRSALLTSQVVAALHKRDLQATTEALRVFDREFSGKVVPIEDLRYVRDISNCADDGGLRERCRDGDFTTLYGYFSVHGTLGTGHQVLEGQCLKSAGSDEYFPTPLRFGEADEKLRTAILSINAACRREASIALRTISWNSALQSRNTDALESTAAELISELDAWAIEIDGFDSENKVSRFQARALSFYVRQVMRLYRSQGMYVQPQEEILSASRERAAIQPFFDAALPRIVAGEVGFMKIDNVGLAGFVARHATWLGQSQGEAVWRLVGATFGAGTNHKTGSLAAVRSAMSDEEVLVTAVHPQDGLGVIMAVGKTGWPWIQELNVGPEDLTSKMGAIISDAVEKRPTEASLFPLAAARDLYAAYICPVGHVGAFTTTNIVAANENSKPEIVQLPSEANRIKRKTLIFVPDQVMERIPLSLLSKPIGGCLGHRPSRNVFSVVRATELGNVSWIGDEFSVKIMPFHATNNVRKLGASALASERTAYLGVGPANRSPRLPNPNNDPRISQSNIAAELPFLPGAQAEFANLNSPAFRGAELLSTSNATEKELRRALKSKPRILHFATHGLDPASNRFVIEPLLVLTRGNEASYRFDDDGVLAASEISEFEIPNARVVLSACKTASPLTGLGKGIFSGLVQSFFGAGAKEVVATYWPVDDEAAAILVPDFVSGMNDRHDTAAALFEAQNAFRASYGSKYNGLWSHPYFWAPFIVVTPNGGTRP